MSMLENFQPTSKPPGIVLMAKSCNCIDKLCREMKWEGSGILECFVGDSDRFFQSLIRFENDDQVTMIVILGGPKGTEEIEVSKMITNNVITKTVIAFCVVPSSTYRYCGDYVISDQQTAVWIKNNTLRSAGAIVPNYYHQMAHQISEIFISLCRYSNGTNRNVADDQENTSRRISHNNANNEEQGSSKVAQPITPRHVKQFMIMCLDIIAKYPKYRDPSVDSWAEEELVVPHTSGHDTIINWFGESRDDTARQLYSAMSRRKTPETYAGQQSLKGQEFRRRNPNEIVYSNRDFLRLKSFVVDKTKFPQSTPLLDFAMAVEPIGHISDKKADLDFKDLVIVTLFDIVHHSGMFTREEAVEAVEDGILNERLFSSLN